MCCWIKCINTARRGTWLPLEVEGHVAVTLSVSHNGSSYVNFLEQLITIVWSFSHKSTIFHQKPDAWVVGTMKSSGTDVWNFVVEESARICRGNKMINYHADYRLSNRVILC